MADTTSQSQHGELTLTHFKVVCREFATHKLKRVKLSKFESSYISLYVFPCIKRCSLILQVGRRSQHLNH